MKSTLKITVQYFKPHSMSVFNKRFHVTFKN